MRRRQVGSWLAAALVSVAALGCGSPAHVLSGAGGSTGAGLGGRRGAAGAAGFGGAGAMDGGGGATAGAAGGSVQTCTTPVMEYCAAKSSFTCTPTWAAVLADTSECPLIGTGVDDLRGACGGIDVRELFLVLEEDDVYYDVTTGNLVAIWSRAAGAPGSCLAGPANFVPPMCATDALSKVSCPDGGADGPDASPD